MKKTLLFLALSLLCGFSYAQLTVTANVQNVPCYGLSYGSATISVSGGTPAYSFTWTQVGVTGNAIQTGLAAGVYTVLVQDASAATGSVIVTITQPTVLSATASQTNAICAGSCTGAFNILPTGGTPPYTFYTTMGTTTPTNINVCAGTYSYSVTDSKSCIFSNMVTLTAASSSLTAVISTTNVACGSSCTGSASATASGGTPPYSYTWSPGGIHTAVVSGLCVGPTTLQVRDANNCLYTQMASISQLSPMTLTVNVTNPTCGLLCNGSATAVVSGPVTGPFTYSWIFSNGQSFTTATVQNRCAGSYDLTVTDVNGCSKSMTGSITAPVNAMPNATLSAVRYNETCYLTGDGAIDLTVTGTNPGPFAYQWSNGATTQDINNITSGTYTVVVSDASQACASYSGSVTAVGTNCGTISGNVFVDGNTDCVKNGSDYNFQNAMIVVNPGNRLAYSDPAGDYIVNSLPYGTYSVSLAPGTLVASCNATITTSVSAGTPNSINNSMALLANASTQPNVLADAYSTGVVPGFTSRMNYYVRNLNFNPSSGQFKVIFPAAFAPFITTIFPAGSTQSGDTVIWNYNLTGFYSLTSSYIDFVPPVSTVLGSTFTTCVIATTTVPDLVPANNTFCYSRLVTGSFDPNDKTVSPVGAGTAGNITVNDKELNYLIRFQNTGNGPAVNIVVKDTLSTFLDVMSLEMLSASHPYKIDILQGNVLRWKFDNIMLADSGSNEPASHGYIQYRIKQKPNNALGTQIKNTAYIYFDFNAPVITNTALNTIWQAPVGIEALNNVDGNWLVYPNPASNMLYLHNGAAFTERTTQLEMVNAMGQIVHTENFAGSTKTLDLSTYAGGVYFVKLVTEKESTIKRIVISR